MGSSPSPFDRSPAARRTTELLEDCPSARGAADCNWQRAVDVANQWQYVKALYIQFGVMTAVALVTMAAAEERRNVNAIRTSGAQV